jgi:DNA-binding GntR family transcriptional regulator
LFTIDRYWHNVAKVVGGVLAYRYSSGELREEYQVPLDALPRISDDSRRHRVVAALRGEIVAGRLRPGDRLVESDLSERMGVSRGPIREALRQLEHEGLVISSPYRGTEVLGISQEEVEQVLIPIRLILERFAFPHTLRRMDEEDFERLEDLIRDMSEAAERRDLDQIVGTELAFHEFVISKSGQPHCSQIWRAIIPRVRAYFYADGLWRENSEEVIDEHRELLHVMRTGDVAKVLTEVEKHIRHRPRRSTGRSTGEAAGAGEPEV